MKVSEEKEHEMFEKGFLKCVRCPEWFETSVNIFQFRKSKIQEIVNKKKYKKVNKQKIQN
jgi:hypothetical protein